MSLDVDASRAPPVGGVGPLDRQAVEGSASRSAPRFRRFFVVAGLPHMPDGQDDYAVADHAIARDVAGRAEGHEELTHVRLFGIDRSKTRKPFECLQLGQYGGDSTPGCLAILLGQEVVQSVEVGDGVSGVDYLCHFGARFGLRVPSDFAHASSSACVACSPVCS